MTYSILNGNCLDRLKELEDNSIDAICTDPPYGINFMGKKWDYDVPGVEIWKECLRVLKPGGHLLSFAGTRTQHRMAVNIEDAGFEIRDMIAWVYGSGFPKSHDISKAIDKVAGVIRPTTPLVRCDGKLQSNKEGGGWKQTSEKYVQTPVFDGSTEDAKQWKGWGTALKPAMEPITMARKPLEGTVAANVLAHGTGGINVDGCRVETTENLNGGAYCSGGNRQTLAGDERQGAAAGMFQPGKTVDADFTQPAGRWPANLTHDGGDEVLELFPTSKSTGGSASLGAFRNGDIYGKGKDIIEKRDPGYGDNGSAARFFYSPKASKTDKNEGLTTQVNDHPTVKPTDLMRYLCRLITPPGGTILDPFMGSGSTGKAALLEGFNFIGIDLDQNYCKIAEERLQAIRPPATLDELFV